jgi:hypothetical protein
MIVSLRASTGVMYCFNMNKNETVCVSWCHHGQVDAYFAHSMIDLIRIRGDRIKNFHDVLGTGLLAKSRNILVDSFLENTEDDWLLLVDSDEYISVDAFDKLVSVADKDKHRIISGLCFSSTPASDGSLMPTPTPTIFIIDEKQGFLVPYLDYPKNSLVEIDSAGTGCLLIHRSVLEEMRKAYSGGTGEKWCWFQDGPVDDNGVINWISEDIMFCRRVKGIGVQIFAHTGALFPHHKQYWLLESHYDSWYANTKASLLSRKERRKNSKS